MSFNLIVTIGEALTSSPEKLRKIGSYGDCIYRINGAHIELAHLNAIVKKIRGILNRPKIMLDLPGNKIRTQGLSEPICLTKGETFDLYDYQVNYPQVYSFLKKGDIILANDSTTTLEVQSINGKTAKILSHSNGLLTNNKGLHMQGIYRHLPFLFEKDIELITYACAEQLDYLSLSYVRTAEDIQEVKRLLAQNDNAHIQIFAKVETAQAVENLSAILKEVDHINLDRGDLSADIGILNLPLTQERIIKSAQRAGKSIYLATQFLKNMEHNPMPSIAEIVDLYKTVKTGVSGIQLSEETAVGKYPVECVKLVFDIFNQSL